MKHYLISETQLRHLVFEVQTATRQASSLQAAEEAGRKLREALQRNVPSATLQ